MIRFFLPAAAFVAVIAVSAGTASAQFGQGNSPNNLFAQYYTQPGASMVEAGMYNAPHWVPSNVGHTYYTYQPLMPHEMMYQHSRNYYNYYNTGGYYGAPNALNQTTVKWQSGTNHMGPLPFSGNIVQSAKWKWHKHRFCLDGSCGPNLGSRLHGAVHGLGSRLHAPGGCLGGNCGDHGDYHHGHGDCQTCGNGQHHQ